MLQTQIRYIQTVLLVSIFVTIFLENQSLVIATYIGLILCWQTELLICELKSEKKELLLILCLLSLSFFPVLDHELNILSNNVILFFISIFLGIVFILFGKINIYSFGHLIFISSIALLLNNYVMSKLFFENIEFITFLFLMLFFIKTLATFLNIQFSNFQYFFNFFAAFFVITIISLFSGHKIQFIFITAGLVSLISTILNFLIQRNRGGYQYFSATKTQIFIYDYMISFLFSLLVTDALNLLNGVF